MRLNSGFENRKVRIDMLPLIDVVFLLLVFFIYAMLSMVVHRGMAVHLPFASTSIVEQEDYIAVSISEDNRVSVNRDPVDLEALAGVIQARQSEAGFPTQIFIECDEKADAGLAIRVLDRLRAAGIEDVLFSSRERR